MIVLWVEETLDEWVNDIISSSGSHALNYQQFLDLESSTSPKKLSIHIT